MSDSMKEVRKLFRKDPRGTATLLFKGLSAATKKQVILQLKSEIKDSRKVCFAYKDGKISKGWGANAGPAEYAIACSRNPYFRFENPEDLSAWARTAKTGKVTCGTCLRSKHYIAATEK